MKNGVCPKCESTVIVRGVRVLDRGHGHVENDLSVAVYANPNAWLFKGRVTGELWACVCGACGYTELYATNLDALVKAAVEGQAQDGAGQPVDDASQQDDLGQGDSGT